MCFCDSEEYIHYLFITCPFSHLLEGSRVRFNLSPPVNLTNFFRNWLTGIDKKNKARICVGIYGLLWSLWNCRYDLVLNKNGNAMYLQVIQELLH